MRAMNNRRPLTDAEKEMAELLGRTIHERGMTQDQVAAALGVTQGVVWQWVNARIAVSPEKAMALGELLGIDPSKLSRRVDRIIEGTGRAVMRFSTGREAMPPAPTGVRDADAPRHRPSVRKLIDAIATAETQGSLSDAIARSLATLVEALPKPPKGEHG